MDRHNSPLRMLAKTHANALITREQYIEIRARLLKKLETKGRIDESDLSNFTTLVQKSNNNKSQKNYGASDWIIIGLGLAASAVLAYVLYG
jgi:hypothetical protein